MIVPHVGFQMVFPHEWLQPTSTCISNTRLYLDYAAHFSDIKCPRLTLLTVKLYLEVFFSLTSTNCRWPLKMRDSSEKYFFEKLGYDSEPRWGICCLFGTSDNFWLWCWFVELNTFQSFWADGKRYPREMGSNNDLTMDHSFVPSSWSRRVLPIPPFSYNVDAL